MRNLYRVRNTFTGISLEEGGVSVGNDIREVVRGFAFPVLHFPNIKYVYDLLDM